jgi:transposase
MEHGTTLLLGLGGVRVEPVEVDEDGIRIVHVRPADPAAAGCPSCGVVSTTTKGRWRAGRVTCLRRGCAPAALA